MKKMVFAFVFLLSLVAPRETNALFKEIILGGSAAVNGGVSLVTGLVAGVALKAAVDCLSEGQKMSKEMDKANNPGLFLPIFAGGLMGAACGVTGFILGGVSAVTGVTSVMSVLGLFATK